MDGLFQDLEDDVQFNRDQILTEDTTRSLQDYANAGLQGINYTAYIVQTRSIISDLNAGSLIGTLTGVRDQFTMVNQVSDKLLSYSVLLHKLFCVFTYRLHWLLKPIRSLLRFKELMIPPLLKLPTSL